MSLEPTLLQQTLTDEFQSFPVLSQSNNESHANLSSYFVSEAQTTTMLNEPTTNDECCTSVCCSADLKENSEANVSFPICNEKCRVSLIETHVDICRENNEFRVIPDVMISDNQRDDKSCVDNCEMEIQKEENCSDSRKKLIETIKERLEICRIDLTQHLLISVKRGFCFYDFSKFFRKLWNKKNGISSIDLHLLESVVVTKVVFPVNFIQVKQ